MRTRLSLGLVLALVLGSLALAPNSAVAQSPAPTLLRAKMLGTAEVPGPGDPDGLGFASVTVLADQRQVCYTLNVVNIATPTAAHIHVGGPTVAGPIVLPLETPARGSISACATNVDAALIARLISNPSNYYVNVHNATYPNGAIRGQLRVFTDSIED
ncbi:MAG: CHRD domain-containing protein [Dehalococcoidia bacterium]